VGFGNFVGIIEIVEACEKFSKDCDWLNKHWKSGGAMKDRQSCENCRHWKVKSDCMLSDKHHVCCWYEFKKEETEMFKKGDRVVIDGSSDVFYFVDYDRDGDVITQYYGHSSWIAHNNWKESCTKFVEVPEIRSFWLWDAMTEAKVLCRTESYYDENLKDSAGDDIYEMVCDYKNIKWKRKVEGSEIRINMSTGEVVE